MTLTFDLWTPKSIVFILSPFSPLLTCQPNVRKIKTTVQSLLCSQGHFHVCPLWPWLLTLKINRVHPLIIVNMYAKFNRDTYNGSVSIAFTMFLPYKSIGTLTFDLQINRVPLTMVNMSAKFDDKAYNGSISIVFQMLFPYNYVNCDLDLQNQ